MDERRDFLQLNALCTHKLVGNSGNLYLAVFRYHHLHLPQVRLLPVLQFNHHRNRCCRDDPLRALRWIRYQVRKLYLIQLLTQTHILQLLWVVVQLPEPFIGATCGGSCAGGMLLLLLEEICAVEETLPTVGRELDGSLESRIGIGEMPFV